MEFTGKPGEHDCTSEELPWPAFPKQYDKLMFGYVI